MINCQQRKSCSLYRKAEWVCAEDDLEIISVTGDALSLKWYHAKIPMGAVIFTLYQIRYQITIYEAYLSWLERLTASVVSFF